MATKQSTKKITKEQQALRDGEAEAFLKCASGLGKDLREGIVFSFDITYRKKRRARENSPLRPGRAINLKYVFDSAGAP